MLETPMPSTLRQCHAGILASWLFAAAIQIPVDDRAAVSFVRELQRAVARDDRAAVAALVQYPLTVHAGGVRIPVHDSGDLVLSYDAVFSPALKLVIARAALPGRGRPPTGSAIEITANGVTIGGDAVRIEPVGGRLKITAIHVPLAASSTERTAGGGGGSRAPRRIALAFGRIQHAGALGRGGHDAYLLWARKNQVLDVRITGVSGRDIVVRIVNVKTGGALDARAQSGVRTWVGRIPEDGDYRLDVVRLASGGPAQLLYDLALSLR
jgi:hypothetical protein